MGFGNTCCWINEAGHERYNTWNNVRKILPQYLGGQHLPYPTKCPIFSPNVNNTGLQESVPESSIEEKCWLWTKVLHPLYGSQVNHGRAGVGILLQHLVTIFEVYYRYWESLTTPALELWGLKWALGTLSNTCLCKKKKVWQVLIDQNPQSVFFLPDNVLGHEGCSVRYRKPNDIQ